MYTVRLDVGEEGAKSHRGKKSLANFTLSTLFYIKLSNIIGKPLASLVQAHRQQFRFSGKKGVLHRG